MAIDCTAPTRPRPRAGTRYARRQRRVERDLGDRRSAPSRRGSSPSRLRPARRSRRGRCPRPSRRPSIAPLTIPSPGWKVTVTEVSSRSGGVPAPASACESAIEKHDAQAAAISSSGLVRPSGVSAREDQVTSSGPNAPLPTPSIVPLPSINEPVHVTFAVRSVAIQSPPSSVVVMSMPTPASRRSDENEQPCVRRVDRRVEAAPRRARGRARGRRAPSGRSGARDPRPRPS